MHMFIEDKRMLKEVVGPMTKRFVGAVDELVERYGEKHRLTIHHALQFLEDNPGIVSAVEQDSKYKFDLDDYIKNTLSTVSK